MKGKRLFWAAIIVVELVLVYLLWKPTQAHFGKQAHRTAPAVTQPADNETAANTPAPTISVPPKSGSAPLPPMRPPAAPATHSAPPATTAKAAPHPNPPAAAKSSVIAAVPHKPSPIPHIAPRTRGNPPAINAGLISRVPVTAKKFSPAPLSPLDSFWCQMSNIDSTCNCKGTDERAANAPPYARPTP